MGRPPCCDKANVKRGLWTAEEDAKILAYVATHGTGNWTQVPKKAGLNRCGKSCRLRWTNYLRPDLKHEEFTEQEEELIVQFHAVIGSRWSLIAKQLPGRTDNDVKNYWNTKLKKKLSKMGIDPITHKPITEILSDYQNITTNHLMRPLNNMSLPNLLSSQSEISSVTVLSNVPSPNIGRFATLNFHSGHLDVSESFNSYSVLEQVSPSSSSSSSSSSASNGKSPNLEEEFNYQKLLEPNTWAPVICTDHCDSKSATSDSNAAVGENSEDRKYCEESSSSVSSFVKALLDRDSEMQQEFPSFDDILDY